MKKLLLLVAASSALTITACGTNEIKTQVSDKDLAMNIGESSFSRQDIYEVLKLAQGGNIVTSWFREAIYFDADKDATAKVNARIEILWEEFKETIWYPETLKSALEGKKYFCAPTNCDDAEAKYKKDVLKPTAIDELFTEFWLQENTKAEKDYFEDYQPRHVWALQKDTLSNITTTRDYILGGSTAVNVQERFADQAAYFHYGKSLINNRSYYDADLKYLGNKLEAYGKKGILQDVNYYGTTTGQVRGSDYYSSGRYLKTGALGTILNTNSTLPSSITKHLFNEDLAVAEAGKAPYKPGEYQGAWLNSKGILEFKEADTKIDENGNYTGPTSTFFTETGDTHYIVKADIVKFDDEINTTTEQGKRRLEARRQIAKVSAVKTKAQNQLFKKYTIEAWDQVIWDAIESTILNNKD